MKIWFLSIEFSAGTFSGNGVYAISQVRALTQAGIDIVVVCGTPPGFPPPPSSSERRKEPAPDIIYIELPRWGTLTDTCAWQEYAQGASQPDVINRLINFQPDIILGVDWHSAPAYHATAAALKKLRKPVPPFAFANYRVYLRSAANEEERRLFAATEGLALSTAIASTVLSSSDYTFVRKHFLHFLSGEVSDPAALWQKDDVEEGNFFEKGFTTGNLHVLLPALRSDLVKNLPNASSPPPKRTFLLCAVRASPEKEPERFIELVAALHNRGFFNTYPHILPLVLGAGWSSSNTDYQADLQRRFLNAAPNKAQIAQGFLSPNQLIDIYQRTLLNVHPCVYDAYGMTIVEAASQAAPTLLDIGCHVGATDLLPPSKDLTIGIDFVNTSIEHIAEQVEKLLVDETDMLVQIGRAAQQVALNWTESENATRLVDILQRAMSVVNEVNSVDVVEYAEMSLERFRLGYLARNKPVLIKGVASLWPLTTDITATTHTDESDCCEINIDFLEDKFGDCIVSTTEINRHGMGEGYGEEKCREMTMKEYCSYWRQYKQRQEESLLYLKDWHFVNDKPEYTAYQCPEYFVDDWLNEWYDYKTVDSSKQSATTVTTSDYRFCYLGPKGTFTPVHSDVMRSHSWSANVVGVKKWLLLPPRYAHLLMNTTGLKTVDSFFNDNDKDVEKEFPGLEEAKKHLVTVIQPPGSALFVPSGWWHSVENITDALSINHNWIEGHCISDVWEYLKDERNRAADLLEDCRDICSPDELEELVQRNTAANAGMNYYDLREMLMYVADTAIQQLHDDVGVGNNKVAADACSTHNVEKHQSYKIPPVYRSNSMNKERIKEMALWRLLKCGEILSKLVQETHSSDEGNAVAIQIQQDLLRIASVLEDNKRIVPWNDLMQV